MQRIRARRRARQFREAGVAFIHVPRTAGTSIARTLYQAFIGHFGLSDLLAVAPEDVLALPRFTIVRNPWDRAVSAWSFARTGGSRLVPVSNPGQYQAPAFENFERFVIEWLSAVPVEQRDGIFRPQYRYVLDAEGTLNFSHCGRLEALAETEAWLSDVCERRIAFAALNASERDDYRSYYTPEARDAVARIYARDIALLGYDF